MLPEPGGFLAAGGRAVEKRYSINGRPYMYGRVGMEAVRAICPTAFTTEWFAGHSKRVAGETESGRPICIEPSDEEALDRSLLD